MDTQSELRSAHLMLAETRSTLATARVNVANTREAAEQAVTIYRACLSQEAAVEDLIANIVQSARATST